MSWMKAIAALGMGGFATGALAIGCSSEPDVPPDPLAAESGFCAELAKVVCSEAVVSNCYGATAGTLAEDTEACVSNAEREFCNSQNLVYRAGGAQGCIDAYGAAYLDARLEVAELEGIDTACHATLSGTGTTGDSCELDSDCDGSQSFRCVAKPGAAGTCQIPKEVAAGDKCGGAADVCPEDRYCNADVNACIARQAEGDACSDVQPCDADTYCSDAVCVAKDSNGTTGCTLNESCSGGFCDIDEGDIDGGCKAALPIDDSNGQCALFLGG